MTSTTSSRNRGGRTAPNRLRGRAHQAALTAHVLSSVGWFGAAVVVAFCCIAAASTGDAATADAYLRTIETSPWLTVPLGAVAVVTGAVLSLGTVWGFVRHWWLVAKLVIAAVMIVTDVVIVAPAARDSLASGSATHLFGPTIAHCVALGIATVLSVFKPKGRTPWGKRVEARQGRTRQEQLAAARASLAVQDWPASPPPEPPA